MTITISNAKRKCFLSLDKRIESQVMRCFIDLALQSHWIRWISTALNLGTAFNTTAVLFVFTTENGINIHEFAISHLNFCIEVCPRSNLLTFIELNKYSKWNSTYKKMPVWKHLWYYVRALHISLILTKRLGIVF